MVVVVGEVAVVVVVAVEMLVYPRGLHLGLFRQHPLRELISPNLVCMYVCMYVRHAQKIACEARSSLSN